MLEKGRDLEICVVLVLELEEWKGRERMFGILVVCGVGGLVWYFGSKERGAFAWCRRVIGFRVYLLSELSMMLMALSPDRWLDRKSRGSLTAGMHSSRKGMLEQDSSMLRMQVILEFIC